jgi:probable F420-dependent oxidoreductase
MVGGSASSLIRDVLSAPMKIDAMIGGEHLATAQAFGREVEAAGFDGLWFTESGRSAYLACAAAALATTRIDIGTGIAVAFPRAPFVTAGTAWELAEATSGRFILGLGTQVKGHIERRYSVPFSPPGPRLREYTLAVRAVWSAFQTGEPLHFDGTYWPMTIGSLGQAWSGGRIDHPDIPIYLAAVRPWMLRMVGEVADGLHVHPFHSVRYLEEVIRPALAAGAAVAGRDASNVTLAVPVLTTVGDTDEERAAGRERARFQIAFYGSTRSYGGVFDLHGWPGTSDRLHALQRQGDFAGMSAVITDEMLDTYTVGGTWDELPDRLRERYDGVADRLIMYFSGSGWKAAPSVIERWATVCASMARTA